MKGRKIVTYHRGWTYIAAWLGLVEVAQVEPAPGVTPTLLQLTDLAVRMKHEGVDTIIVAPYHAGATASLAAHLADARLIVVPSDVGGTAAVRDYVRLVDAVIDGLRLAWQAPTVAAAPTPRRPFSYRIE